MLLGGLLTATSGILGTVDSLFNGKKKRESAEKQAQILANSQKEQANAQLQLAQMNAQTERLNASNMLNQMALKAKNNMTMLIGAGALLIGGLFVYNKKKK